MRIRDYAVPFVVLSCAFAVPRLHAQAESPQKVADQMMAAVRTGDWPRASSLMHPAALKQLRDLLQPILAFAGPEADGIRQQLFGFASMAEAKAASDSTVFVQLMNAV